MEAEMIQKPDRRKRVLKLILSDGSPTDHVTKPGDLVFRRVEVRHLQNLELMNAHRATGHIQRQRTLADYSGSSGTCSIKTSA